MHKQFRQISKAPMWFAACGLILGIFCAIPSSFAQTGTPIALKNDVWSLKYTVTVVGDFKKEPEVGSGKPTINYHINRLYEGTSKLKFSTKIIYEEKFRSSGLTESELNALNTSDDSFTGLSSHLQIKIKDFWNTKYDPVCNEFESIEEYWDADVSNDNKTFPILWVNDNSPNYKINFPIRFIEGNWKEIQNKKFEIYNKAAGGREVKHTAISMLSFASHHYPNVKGFIVNESIIRAPNWSELKVDEGGNRYHYTSDVLHPDEPLIEGVSDSKDKVNIIVYYSFTRVKG